MKFYNLMSVANRVLKIVKRVLTNAAPASKATVYIGPYQNGREHGYKLHGYISAHSIYIAFSENRNSDEIVVYHGNTGALAGLSDEMYKNAMYFKPDDEKGAAKYIAKLILESTKGKRPRSRSRRG